MKQQPKIDVALSPLLFQNYFLPDKIVVVTDVLRATSAICTAFEYGAEAIIPVATIEEAQAFKAKGFLVGAERNGEKLPEFDFGNSPFEYMTEKIKGQTIVLTTTNGTKAVKQAQNAHQLLIGAFTNFTAL
ncbi:MAG: 2-phosphosulfolactate phosphatase, partial [Bacteroidetes bacterium]